MNRNPCPPQLSIVTCAVNEEHYIKESVKSVLSSAIKDFKLIIINDSSSDGTLKVLSAIAILDRRIKIFTNELNWEKQKVQT